MIVEQVFYYYFLHNNNKHNKTNISIKHKIFVRILSVSIHNFIVATG